MKKFTKALAISLGVAAVGGAFAPNASAQALLPPPCAACSPWVLSPDEGALAFGETVAINGGILTFTSSATQAAGTYGAGFTMFGGGTMKFDADLYSYDAIGYDTFIVTMSTSGYYWTDGYGASTFTWGGANFPGLEEYHTAVGGFDSLTLSSESDVYVSFIMQTTVDNSYPSQGSFHVNVVPEPETYAMLLAGLGLMGFVARRRQKKLATA